MFKFKLDGIVTDFSKFPIKLKLFKLIEPSVLLVRHATKLLTIWKLYEATPLKMVFELSVSPWLQKISCLSNCWLSMLNSADCYNKSLKSVPFGIFNSASLSKFKS